MKGFPTMYTLALRFLHCYFVEEHISDDVYLKFNGKKIWPKYAKCKPLTIDSMTELDVEIVGLRKNEEIEIELWDWDLLSRNDMLGKFIIRVDEKPGMYSTDMEQNERETKKAKYALNWESTLID